MVENIPIPLDINYKFNGIKFHDDIHKYYLGDKNLISVTTMLHKYVEPFDEEFWSEKKALDYDMDQRDIVDMWRAWNLKSTVKGSAIHNYAELKYNNKVFKFTQADIDLKITGRYADILKMYPIIYKEKIDLGIIEKMEGYTILEEYNTVKQYVDKFYLDSYNILIPVKTEFVVYDEEWSLAGMMDIVFWNVKMQCFQIWDWKTNKEFQKEQGKFNKKLKFPLSKFYDTHFNLYSLQLSAYKSIIMRNTSIKIEGMYVVWFNEVNPTYEVIKLNDYSEYIPRLIDNQSI